MLYSSLVRAIYLLQPGYTVLLQRALEHRTRSTRLAPLMAGDERPPSGARSAARHVQAVPNASLRTGAFALALADKI